MFAGKEPFPTIYVESQKEGEVCIIQFISHSLICQNCYTPSYDTVDKQEITWIKLKTCDPLFLDGQFETDPF